MMTIVQLTSQAYGRRCIVRSSMSSRPWPTGARWRVPPAGSPHPGLTPSALHRAPVGQGPPGPGWLAIFFGFWSGRALATGTAWAGLCLVHHHRASSPFHHRGGKKKIDDAGCPCCVITTTNHPASQSFNVSHVAATANHQRSASPIATDRCMNKPLR